jgi:hypothetical protein
MGMGMGSMGKGRPAPELELEKRILEVFMRNDFLPSSVVHKRLMSDIERYGKDVLKLAYNLSPSQLGRMGLLGVRRLAQLRRDNPQRFEKVMKELKEVIGNE